MSAIEPLTPVDLHWGCGVARVANKGKAMNCVFCVERQGAYDDSWVVTRVYKQKDAAEEYTRVVMELNAKSGVYAPSYRVREWQLCE